MKLDPKIERLVTILEKRGEASFVASVRRIKGGVTDRVIEKFIIDNDINSLVKILGINNSAFDPLRSQIGEVFQIGGERFRDGIIKRANGNYFFDVQKQSAQSWLLNKNTNLISGLTLEQNEEVRKLLAKGVNSNYSKRQLIQRLAGITDRRTGERVGGILGLTERQNQTSARLLENLQSNDPKRMRQYFSLSTRDKRYDAAVRNAIKTGNGLSPDQINKILIRHESLALANRAKVIAETEIAAAFNAGQIESARQAIELGIVNKNMVVKSWVTRGDALVRGTHIVLGKNSGGPIGIEEKFKSPSGATLDHPGDPSAPMEEIIRCRCSMVIGVDLARELR